MSWVRLDDGFFNHPKVMELSKDAKLLYLATLCYCALAATDGHLTPAKVKAVAGQQAIKPSAAKELVRQGLWDLAEGGYVVPSFLEFNPSSEQRKAQAEATKQRVNAWRNGKRNGVGNGVTTPPVTPATPSPTPYLEPSSSTNGLRPEPDDDDWVAARQQLATRPARCVPIGDEQSWLREAATRNAVKRQQITPAKPKPACPHPNGWLLDAERNPVYGDDGYMVHCECWT